MQKYVIFYVILYLIIQLQRSDNYDFQSEKLIKILKTSKIIKVENAPKGTQLKLLAHMENNLSAIIKPKW